MPSKKRHTVKSKPLESYGFYRIEKNSDKIKRIREHLNDSVAEKPRRIASIIYRPDGRLAGHGAYFDHRCLQINTKCETRILKEQETSEHLHHYLNNQTTLKLPYEVSSISEAQGLLYIPGIPRSVRDSSELYQQRQQANNAFIQQAINRGMPILGVCGGSWAIWEFFQGTLTKAKDHCHARMPNIKTNGKVGYNAQIHRIELTQTGKILKAAMNYESNAALNPYPSVNSIHWLAPDQRSIPDNLEVSALSRKDDSIAPKNRHNRPMSPEENSIEGFESKAGAPILGIQWHPEAYSINVDAQFHPQQQRDLINYMIAAGQTYTLKQELNKEFRDNRLLIQCLRKKTKMTQSMIPELRPSELSFWKKEYLKDQKDSPSVIDLTL